MEGERGKRREEEEGGGRRRGCMGPAKERREGIRLTPLGGRWKSEDGKIRDINTALFLKSRKIHKKSEKSMSSQKKRGN